MKDIDKDNLVRERLAKGNMSVFRTYVDLTVGDESLSRFLLYEFLTMVLGALAGGIGFYLRKKLYPALFNKVGRGLIIGRNVVIRHPHKIKLGNNITIDENCLIDARGAGSEGLILEDNVIVNRNCIIQAKAGPIRLGKRTSIGSNSVIVSMDGVEVGEAVLIAGGCYISAGSYYYDDSNIAVMDQGVYTKGPIIISTKAWLGTRVTVLDGVTIGVSAVVGSGSVVVRDVPPAAIVVGVPARVIKKRGITS